MIISMDQPNIFGDVITFPQWAGSEQPKPASEILETIIIQGTNSSVNQAAGGTADQAEN